MVVSACTHESRKKHGRDRQGNQRFRCKLCGATWAEESPKPLGDMRIGMKEATTALGMLLEGLSMRAVSRLTGLDRGTLDTLVLTVGDNCAALMESIEDVEVHAVAADETWAIIAMKEMYRVANAHSEVVDSHLQRSADNRGKSGEIEGVAELVVDRPIKVSIERLRLRQIVEVSDVVVA